MVGKVLNILLNGSLVRKKVKEVYTDGDLLHIIAEDEYGLTHDIYFNLHNPTGVAVVVTDKDKVLSAWYYGDSVMYIRS
ncbi:hypothetical protein YS40_087 [Thermus phage phiYS40]|uniref:hypothetical protein n=1 Tax=Thermus phage phiYS40 TaxID=407392 RepID=UPI0000E689CD|nr:hypothetical protein YS40_087 [Thermus phage phiYS40]ABJ91481.1 hypothetical protein YS40_087 [Thermus phage phiYS40]BAK53605.1 hypothetical protein YSP_087 [Thermus phage phiYS40]